VILEFLKMKLYAMQGTCSMAAHIALEWS